MMLCDCKECSGNENSLEMCINGAAEAEFEHMKSEMNKGSFWILFFVVCVVLLAFTLFGGV